jgi:flap endonuclease-1
MGVNLTDIVERRTCELREFSDKVIAIDAYNALYQFLATIRQRDGTPLMDSHGRITSHLSGLFYRTANLIELGIRPVYVFDGAPVRLKLAEIEERREAKQKAMDEWKEALKAGDLKEAKSKAQATAKLTREMVEDSKRVLDGLGVPWLDAPHDGEAQASHMAAKGDAYAAASQDYDSLLFGASRLVRNVTMSGRRKLPMRDVYVDVKPELVALDEALKALGLTRVQLVDVGILIGTDFNEGMTGIGPKKAVKLIKEYGSIEKARVKDMPIAVENLDELRMLFLEPEVRDDYKIEFGPPEPGKVIAFLCDSREFGRERVDATLQRVMKSIDSQKQRTLDRFF